MSGSFASPTVHVEDASFQLNDVVDTGTRLNIINLVKCAICTQIPVRPIFSCRNGHVICPKCRRRSANCRACRADLTDTRNHVAEELLSSFLFKCKNRSSGCNEMIKWGEVQQHLMTSCEFRPIKCQETLRSVCRGDQIPFNDYLNHLQNVHHIRVFRTQNITTRTIVGDVIGADCVYPQYCIGFEGQVFFQHVRVENKCLFVWITYFGRIEACQEFFATVFVKKDGEEMKVLASVPVHHFRTSFEEIKPSGSYLCVGKEQLNALAEHRNGNDRREGRYAWTIHTMVVKKAEKSVQFCPTAQSSML